MAVSCLTRCLTGRPRQMEKNCVGGQRENNKRESGKKEERKFTHLTHFLFHGHEERLWKKRAVVDRREVEVGGRLHRGRKCFSFKPLRAVK